MMRRLVPVLVLLLFSVPSHAAEIQIPRAAQHYRSELIRAARAVWGLDAPVAVFAEQIHTESWWRNNTVSSAGAQGLAQFMPSTAHWLPQVAPETGEPAPFNPGWSLRALCVYDKYLWDRTRPLRDWKDRARFTSAEAKALSDGARNRAFSVAGLAELDMVNTVYSALTEALESGETLADFKKRIGSVIKAQGWKSHRVETIFRTNMQSAYAAGRYAKQQAASALLPFWRYVSVLPSYSLRKLFAPTMMQPVLS